MKKYFLRLICKRRDIYAEVFSQAYSQSITSDAYLAKQGFVPSSSSLLSGNVSSFDSVCTDDEFANVVKSVDLMQFDHTAGEEGDEIEKVPTTNSILASMAIRTVTSIEEQGSGEYAIETEYLQIEKNLPEKIIQEPIVSSVPLGPMDYHEVSKHVAKQKRTSQPRRFNSRLSPLSRVKHTLMRFSVSDTIQEERDEIVESEAFNDEIEQYRDNYDVKNIIRTTSSLSGMFIEGEESTKR
jgi:hypothetical protein